MTLFLTWLAFGVVALIIANVKGRSGFGWFLLGCLFGPFALVVAALPSIAPQQADAEHESQRADRTQCPYCREDIHREAVVCKHCGAQLAPYRNKVVLCPACHSATPYGHGRCASCSAELPLFEAAPVGTPQ